MVLKRKRSSSEISTSTSCFSSPSRPDGMDMDMNMDSSPVSPLAFSARNFTPSHLPSRTMKRFRNSRPSEEQVHQRTLQMLYTAQQKSEAIIGASPSPFTETPSSQNPVAQRSLHSFWNIKSAPNPPSSGPSMGQCFLSPTACEDCGAGLGSSDEHDGMDLDGYGAEDNHVCRVCRKHVCSHCSVTNLGEQRRCLRCVGPSGGRQQTLRWPSASMSVF